MIRKLSANTSEELACAENDTTLGIEKNAHSPPRMVVNTLRTAVEGLVWLLREIVLVLYKRMAFLSLLVQCRVKVEINSRLVRLGCGGP